MLNYSRISILIDRMIEESSKRKRKTEGTGELLIALSLDKSLRDLNRKLGITPGLTECYFDLISPSVEVQSQKGSRWELDMEKVIRIAGQFAIRYANENIEPIHLLYAVTKVPDCTAIKVLRRMGISIEALAEAVSERLNTTDFEKTFLDKANGSLPEKAGDSSDTA